MEHCDSEAWENCPIDYGFCNIETHTWTLSDHVDQCHANQFNLKRKVTSNALTYKPSEKMTFHFQIIFTSNYRKAFLSVLLIMHESDVA